MATKSKKAPENETAKAKSPKSAKAPKPAPADGGLSALDAAAKVLAENKGPMNAREMIAAMAAKKYWTSPGGKTPQATLYSALLREIQVKGKEARFARTERGKFGLSGSETRAAKPAAKPAKAKAAKSAGGKPGPKAVAELFKL